VIGSMPRRSRYIWIMNIGRVSSVVDKPGDALCVHEDLRVTRSDLQALILWELVNLVERERRVLIHRGRCRLASSSGTLHGEPLSGMGRPRPKARRSRS